LGGEPWVIGLEEELKEKVNPVSSNGVETLPWPALLMKGGETFLLRALVPAKYLAKTKGRIVPCPSFPFWEPPPGKPGKLTPLDR